MVAGRRDAREEEEKSRERIGGLAVRLRSACRPGEEVGRKDGKGVEERFSCVAVRASRSEAAASGRDGTSSAAVDGASAASAASAL